MVTTKLMTVEEFEQLSDDGNRYELVRGELRQMPAGGLLHGDIGMGIGARLWIHVQPGRLGRVYNADTGFRLFPDQETAYMPAVAFVRVERLGLVDDYAKLGRLAPDLVVEVVSPTDRMSKVVEKVMDYLDAGVLLVWVVEPRRRLVTVYGPDRVPRELGEGDVLDGGEVLPDFRLPIVDVFG